MKRTHLESKKQLEQGFQIAHSITTTDAERIRYLFTNGLASRLQLATAYEIDPGYLDFLLFEAE